MTKKKLNFAVIGIGGIGLHHARTIKNQADAQLIGFLDSNADVIARAHAEFPEASVCDTIDCLLSLPELDAVVIATPNVLHAQFSIAAAKRKKHVLCEKPLAMTAVEGQKDGGSD